MTSRSTFSLALLAVALLCCSATGRAATITVTSGADSGGVCPGSDCTLRQAILTALPADTIEFSKAVEVVELTSDQLLIAKDLTISGRGATSLTIQRSKAEGTPSFRIFEIASNVTVVISGLTVANGRAAGDGGGILNRSAALTMADCTMVNNAATGCPGAPYAEDRNGCGDGGGIFNSSGGSLTISRSTITLSHSNSDGGGGGIFNSAGATLQIVDSTLSENYAEYSGPCCGGGGGIATRGTAVIRNSTISGNRSSGRAGGIECSAGTLTLISCTIALNHSQANYAGGVAAEGTGHARLQNTLIVQNEGRIGQIVGSFESDEFSRYRIDARLGPLQDNGGPTFTHALLPDSPAIDQGNSGGLNTDQRGLPRPFDDPAVPNASGGDGTDIGTFERQTSTSTPTPTPTATATPTPTATASPTPGSTPARSLNISTRSRVQTGDNAMIGGFIISGNASKRVILRALGPSLSGSGVADFLADPLLELHGPDGSLIAANDNWKENPEQALQIQASGIPPQHDLEAAIVATLQPAGYTAIVRGKANATGVGLVEVYDLDQNAESTLANISSRAVVDTDENVVIGGFFLGGSDRNAQVIIRAIGPSLAQNGVANAIADPTLELRDGNGLLIAFNDNWQDNPAHAAQLVAAEVQPRDDREAAIAQTLPPGAYTAIVAGRAGGTGVGLVEIYNLR